MVAASGRSAAGGLILLAVVVIVFVLIPLAWMMVLQYLGAPLDDMVERRGLAGWMERRQKQAAAQAYEVQRARDYARRIGGRWPTPPPKRRGGGRFR